MARQKDSASRETPEYWKPRLFRATYTYKGRTQESHRWCMKFQVDGRRRTVTLSSEDPDSAAFEAAEIYRLALRDRGTSQIRSATGHVSTVAARMSAQHWKPRLLRRKYIELLRARRTTEWSVVVDHEQTRRLFPLGTMDANAAAAGAAERFRVIAKEGWRLADLQFEQEFTVSIFWKMNPTICTYSTMLTIPAKMGTPAVRGGPENALIIEPNEGTARALRHWLSRQEGWKFTAHSARLESLESLVQKHRPVLVLVNQVLTEPPHLEELGRITALTTNIPVYTYGIFEDSDGIFASLSGVSGGYMLRRRPPSRIMDPVAGSRNRNLTADRANRLVERYFQRLVQGEADWPTSTPEPSLTIREHEVMVFMAQGLQDKEIAAKLDISTWTVNSHVRHIYRKLNVHGRTEAVVKFLELEKAV